MSNGNKIIASIKFFTSATFEFKVNISGVETYYTVCWFATDRDGVKYDCQIRSGRHSDTVLTRWLSTEEPTKVLSVRILNEYLNKSLNETEPKN